MPRMPGARRELWLEDRREELLPVHYMHVVFTLPEKLNPWVLGQQREGYAALFHAAWDTQAVFAGRQGIQLDMTALLHTSGSQLAFHPHLHCINSCGVIPCMCCQVGLPYTSLRLPRALRQGKTHGNAGTARGTT